MAFLMKKVNDKTGGLLRASGKKMGNDVANRQGMEPDAEKTTRPKRRKASAAAANPQAAKAMRDAYGQRGSVNSPLGGK